MIPILRDILAKTTAEDLKTRQEAILELALLIEKHSPSRDKQTYYEAMLSPELLKVVLSEDEQKELVHEIGQIVLSDKVTGSLVWALSKSHSLDALEYLLAFLSREPPPTEGHAIRQAVLATEVFLSVYQDHPLHDHVFGLARNHRLKDVLEQIAGHCEEDVKKIIQSIKQRL